MVAHGCAWNAREPYIAEYAAHAEHVLTLEVTAVAPTEHLYGESIVARMYVGGYIELGFIVCPLSVANERTVDPNICR